MERIKKAIELKQTILVITGFTALIVSVVLFGIGVFARLDNIEAKIERTKQQALIGNIHNEGMPYFERRIACRRYIYRGFNSETKRFCDELIRMGGN